jgi:hypothetical protein
MAKRTSRKGGGTTKKRPELRTGGGRTAKAERAMQRERQVERGPGGGPLIRIRPAGIGGMLAWQLTAWAIVALLLWGAWMLDRWNVLGYPDSMWLFTAIGIVTVAPAVGRVARTERDADAWGVLSILVPGGIFVAQLFVGPSCPVGGDCAVIGARGSLGMLGSIAVLLVIAVASWGLARWQYRSGSWRRPGSGRVRYHAMLVAMLALVVLPGSAIAASLVGMDILLRKTPTLVPVAEREIERECYRLATAPELAVRASPTGYNPLWRTFAVRRANETRPGIEGARIPDRWATYDQVHPYEATVSFDANGQVVNVTCGMIGPGAGNVTAADLEQQPPVSNPLSPKSIGSQFHPRFFSQGVAGPTEEGERLAQERAEAEAAAQADEDADDAEATPDEDATDEDAAE